MSIEEATFQLTKENNILLKAIYTKLCQMDNNSFSEDVIANLLANSIDINKFY